MHPSALYEGLCVFTGSVFSQLDQLMSQNSHPSAVGKTWSQKARLESGKN